jgi:hypothetical protein
VTWVHPFPPGNEKYRLPQWTTMSEFHRSSGLKLTDRAHPPADTAQLGAEALDLLSAARNSLLRRPRRNGNPVALVVG